MSLMPEALAGRSMKAMDTNKTKENVKSRCDILHGPLLVGLLRFNMSRGLVAKQVRKIENLVLCD